jgi:hypothetical protein
MSGAKPPGRLERGLRFGCGSVFGVVLGFLIAAQFVHPGWHAALIILPIVVGCGLAAARWGDEFWRVVIDSFP